MRIVPAWGAAALLAIATVLTIAPLAAQTTILGDPTRPNGDISVTERRHPELDPLGVRLGSVIVQPSVDLGVYHDDNIYASDRRRRRSDTVATLAATLAAATDWRRDGVTLNAAVARRAYFAAGGESTTDHAFGATGWLDLGRGRADLSLGTARATEARTVVDAPDVAARPIRYDASTARLTVEQPFGRIIARAAAEWRRYRFDDARTTAGTVLPQGFRDHDVASVGGRATLVLNDSTAAYVDAIANRRSYRLAPVAGAAPRGSHGWTTELGVDFDITRLVRGHVQVGYLEQRGMAGTFRVHGLSGRGKLEWFVRPVLTVTVEGGRHVEDAAQSDTPAYLSTDLLARADYELLRNLIVTARGGVTWDRFQATGQHARRAQAGFGAHYRMGRQIVVDASYDHLSQASPAASGLRTFADNRFILSVRLQR